MKLLTLVRHAKSSWKDASLADFDRPLNRRGLRDAPEMGERLARVLDAGPDLILSSPANRARTTAELIAEAIDFPREDILYRDEIYDASARELLALVQGIEKASRHAMLFGHNPGFTDLFNDLVADARIDNIPTCGVARIELEVERWGQVERLCGRLVDFDYPKRESPAG